MKDCLRFCAILNYRNPTEPPALKSPFIKHLQMLGPVTIQGRITSICITSRVKFYYYPCFTDEASDLNVQVKSSNIVKQEVTAMGFEPRST